MPFGSIGLTLFAIDLWLASRGMKRVGNERGDGIPGRLRALAHRDRHRATRRVRRLLHRAAVRADPGRSQQPTHRSRIIAANNILNALFMVVSAGVAIGLLLGGGFASPKLFLVVGMLNAVVAIYIYTLVPEFLMRFLAWILIHTLYRVRVIGRDRLPEHGPAVLVCNHVSFVDALIIGGSCPVPIRFVMHHKIFKIPIMSFIFRTAKAIPVASKKEDPGMLEAAMDKVAEELAQGHIVCIFPEGALTPDGQMQTFKPGIERIIERSPVPVYPMALRGLWRSFFSRSGGRAFFKLPRGIYRRIELVVGEPVAPQDVRAADLEARVAFLHDQPLPDQKETVHEAG